MHIYLGYAAKNIHHHIHEYRYVRDFLKKNKHTIVRDHMDRIKKEKSKKGMAIKPTDIYYKEVMGAIEKADACIFFTHEETMSLGYQIMYSAGKKKPTLVVGSTKNKISIEHVFIAGSGSAYLEFKSYNNVKNLEKYIERFIKKNEKHDQSRLSLHLERPLYDVLVQKAKKEGRTKSEMLEIFLIEKKKQIERHT